MAGEAQLGYDASKLVVKLMGLKQGRNPENIKGLQIQNIGICEHSKHTMIWNECCFGVQSRLMASIPDDKLQWKYQIHNTAEYNQFKTMH